MEKSEQAKRHPISYDKPAPDFFEGALMGNGGLGAVVTTRPDAIVIHFGHNNVWDIRISEDNQDKIGTFEEVFHQLQQIPKEQDSFQENAWYRDYCDLTQENYRKPYPRPMPCGSILLGYDRRKAEVLGHKLHIHNGLCEVYFKLEAGYATLKLFIEPTNDRMWMKLDSPEGPNGRLFDRVKLIPDPDTPEQLPSAETAVESKLRQLSFRQTLPYSYEENTSHPKDRAFRLDVRVSEEIISTNAKDGVQARTAPVGSIHCLCGTDGRTGRCRSRGY